MCLLTNKFKSFKNVYFPQPIFPPTSCHGQMIDIVFLSGLMSGLHETYALGAERRRLLKRHRTSGSSYNHQERLLAFENSESPVIEKKKREVLLRWLTSCLLSSLDQPSVLVLDTAPCHSMLTEESRWSGERPYDWRGVGWWCSFFFMIIFTPSVWRIMATQAMLTNTLTLLYVYRRRRKYNK